jgi:hypothetical protein
VYSMAIWYIYFMCICICYGHFGIAYGHLVHSFPFWYVLPSKSGNPAPNKNESSENSRGQKGPLKAGQS